MAGSFEKIRLDYSALGAQEQAKAILDAALKSAGNPPTRQVGITYSANHEQTEEIRKKYKANEWNGGAAISGTGQATVMAELEKLLNDTTPGNPYAPLRGHFQILPITTMEYDAAKKAQPTKGPWLQEDLEAISKFAQDGGGVLAWQNQESGEGFAVGGGVVTLDKVHNDYIQQSLKQMETALTEGKTPSVEPFDAFEKRTPAPPKVDPATPGDPSAAKVDPAPTPEAATKKAEEEKKAAEAKAEQERRNKEQKQQEMICDKARAELDAKDFIAHFKHETGNPFTEADGDALDPEVGLAASDAAPEKRKLKDGFYRDKTAERLGEKVIVELQTNQTTGEMKVSFNQRAPIEKVMGFGMDALMYNGATRLTLNFASDKEFKGQKQRQLDEYMAQMEVRAKQGIKPNFNDNVWKFLEKKGKKEEYERKLADLTKIAMANRPAVPDKKAEVVEAAAAKPVETLEAEKEPTPTLTAEKEEKVEVDAEEQMKALAEHFDGVSDIYMAEEEKPLGAKLDEAQLNDLEERLKNIELGVDLIDQYNELHEKVDMTGADFDDREKMQVNAQLVFEQAKGSRDFIEQRLAEIDKLPPPRPGEEHLIDKLIAVKERFDALDAKRLKQHAGFMENAEKFEADKEAKSAHKI